MIKIGIAVDDGSVFIKDIINALLSITSLKVNNVLVDKLKNNTFEDDTDVLIVCIDPKVTNIIERFNILVLNAENNYIYQNKLISKLTSEDYLLVNSDDKEVFNNLEIKNCTLITCGFSRKSCITTSSIVENEHKTIQVCIQRGFKTINDKTIDQQEFSVNITSKDNNVFNILSAVTSVLACGVEIESIS